MPVASRWATAVAVVAYAALAVVAWWPLSAHPASTTLAQPFGDPLFNAWTLAWDADRARHAFAGYWDGLFFHPYRDVVAWSEHLLGIALFTAPLQWLTGNPILVLNGAMIASTAWAGIGTYLLARALTGRADAAFVAGVASACAPYRLGHDFHLQVLISGWMPLAFLGLHRFIETGARWALALMAGAFVLQGLSNGYFLYFTGIPLAVIAADGLWRHRRRWREITVGLAAAAVVALVLLAPVVTAYARVRREQGLTRTLADVSQYAATPRDYAQVAPRASFWSRVLPHGGDERQWFPGLVVGVLALVALSTARRRDDPGAMASRATVRLYAAIVVLMAVLSLGPRPLAWWGSEALGGPLVWLMALLPGFDGLRVPARMAVVVHLGLAVLAAFGFAALTARASLPRRTAAFVVACTMLLVEGYGITTTRAFPTPDMDAERSAYAWLATQPGGALLELPVGDAALATRHLYRTLEHGHRIVNGYSGYGSALQDFVAGPPFTEVAGLDGALAMARGLGVRWIAVHPGLYEHHEAGAALAESLAGLVAHVVQVRRFPGVVLMELRPAAPTLLVSAGAAWRELAPSAFTLDVSHRRDVLARAVDGNRATRWSTGAPQEQGEWVSLAFPVDTDVARLRLEVGRRSLGDYPRGLAIDVDLGDGVWLALLEHDVLPGLGASFAREPRTPAIDVVLPPNRVRRLRLRPTGKTRVWFWSIDELRVWRR
jgi:hypothetical protein